MMSDDAWERRVNAAIMALKIAGTGPDTAALIRQRVEVVLRAADRVTPDALAYVRAAEAIPRCAFCKIADTLYVTQRYHEQALRNAREWKKSSVSPFSISPITDEMVERGARALQHDFEPLIPWEEELPKGQEDWRKESRLVLEASLQGEAT